MVDATIRNLGDAAFRALKAWAAIHDKTMGEALSEIILAYTSSQAQPWVWRRSLIDLKPIDFGKGTDHASEEIDKAAYGIRP
ncbi:MAG: hypothetical protein ACYDDF_03530 [Thermoplasmatota archaeon]